MKATLLGLALFMAGGAAEAAQLKCAGNYLFYNFNISGRTSGARVIGKINVLISQGGRTVNNSQMDVTSSNVRPGQSIQFAASSADGAGALEATYNAGQGVYSGILNAQSPRGNVRVPVNCTLQGAFDADEAETVEEIYW